jgi:hypothetical protein
MNLEDKLKTAEVVANKFISSKSFFGLATPGLINSHWQIYNRHGESYSSLLYSSGFNLSEYCEKNHILYNKVSPRNKSGATKPIIKLIEIANRFNSDDRLKLLNTKTLTDLMNRSRNSIHSEISRSFGNIGNLVYLGKISIEAFSIPAFTRKIYPIVFQYMKNNELNSFVEFQNSIRNKMSKNLKWWILKNDDVRHVKPGTLYIYILKKGRDHAIVKIGQTDRTLSERNGEHLNAKHHKLFNNSVCFSFNHVNSHMYEYKLCEHLKKNASVINQLGREYFYISSKQLDEMINFFINKTESELLMG